MKARTVPTLGIIGIAVPRWLQGLLEIKNSPTLRCTASKSAIVCGLPCRAGIAGEPAPALDHAVCIEPGLLGDAVIQGRCTRAGGALVAWRPGGRLQARMAHIKSWGASAAIKSDVNGVQVLNVRM